MTTEFCKACFKFVVQHPFKEYTESANNNGACLWKAPRCAIALELPLVTTDMSSQSNAPRHAVNVHTHKSIIVFALEVEEAAINM